MTIAAIKQVLVSILIGAIISFLTVLFQGLVGMLQNIPAEVPGSIVGMGSYLLKWKTNLIV